MLTSESYNKDCMLGLLSMPDQSIDLGWLDTQYGIGEDGRRSKSRGGLVTQKNGAGLLVQSKHQVKNWDKTPMPTEYWYEIIRVCINYMAFGVNYFQEQFPVKFDWGYKPPRRHEYEDFIKRNPTNFIIWDKCNGDCDFADCELIYTTFNEPTYIKYYMWNGMLQAADATDGTIQQGDKSKNQKRIHPTEKPTPLIRWFFQKYGKPGIKVLDTHSGSQSARIAAQMERINYEGYETDKEYFDKGNYRYEEFNKQVELF